MHPLVRPGQNPISLQQFDNFLYFETCSCHCRYSYMDWVVSLLRVGFQAKFEKGDVENSASPPAKRIKMWYSRGGRKVHIYDTWYLIILSWSASCGFLYRYLQCVIQICILFPCIFDRFLCRKDTNQISVPYVWTVLKRNTKYCTYVIRTRAKQCIYIPDKGKPITIG